MNFLSYFSTMRETKKTTAAAGQRSTTLPGASEILVCCFLGISDLYPNGTWMKKDFKGITSKTKSTRKWNWAYCPWRNCLDCNMFLIFAGFVCKICTSAVPSKGSQQSDCFAECEEIRHSSLFVYLFTCFKEISSEHWRCK